MKHSKQGFTLIELLVVILIIAILAAIALPRYRLAVAKARMSELIMVAKRFHTAQQEYFLVNGRYTENLSLLTVDGMSGSGNTVKVGNVQVSTSSGDNFANYWLIVRRPDLPSSSFPIIEVYSNPGRFECLTQGHENNAEICKLYGGRTRSNNPNYYYMDDF